MDETGWNPELYKKYIATGLHATPVPEAYGGAGLGDVECAVITHELARADAGFAMSMEISWVCADMIRLHGSDEQKEKYLTAVADGKLFAFALTEPDSGSDAAGMRTGLKAGRRLVRRQGLQGLDYQRRHCRLLCRHGHYRPGQGRQGHLGLPS